MYSPMASFAVAGEGHDFRLNNSVLRVPKRNVDDRKFIKSIGSAVMKLQFDSEKMPNKDRDTFIINELSNMEKNGAF